MISPIDLGPNMKQLISYIAPGAPATRRPETAELPFLRPEIGFTPRWYAKSAFSRLRKSSHCCTRSQPFEIACTSVFIVSIFFDNNATGWERVQPSTGPAKICSHADEINGMRCLFLLYCQELTAFFSFYAYHLTTQACN